MLRRLRSRRPGFESGGQPDVEALVEHVDHSVKAPGQLTAGLGDWVPPDGVPATMRYDKFGRLRETNRADGSFEIVMAPRARPGNWLPTGGIERYALMLRLYDTPVGVATRTQRDAPMPSISTVNCP